MLDEEAETHASVRALDMNEGKMPNVAQMGWK